MLEREFLVSLDAKYQPFIATIIGAHTTLIPLVKNDYLLIFISLFILIKRYKNKEKSHETYRITW